MTLHVFTSQKWPHDADLLDVMPKRARKSA